MSISAWFVELGIEPIKISEIEIVNSIGAFQNKKYVNQVPI
jgi:hypothetical protein